MPYNNKENPKFTSYNKGGYTSKYKSKNTRNTKRIVLIAILSVFLVILLGGGIFLLVISNPSNVFNSNVKADDLFAENSPSEQASAQASDPVAELGMPTPEPSVDPYDELLQQADMSFMKDKVNILILGIDRNKNREDWGSFRTDTMIVAMCDFQKHSISLLSIPRDSLVHVGPRFKSMNKINTAFGEGGGEDGDGYKNAMKTVTRVLGVPVTKYIGFDMTVVRKIVDIMDGIDYDVELDVKNAAGETTIRKGQRHLTGTQVLDYCRMRHGSSDFDRIDRQQKMLFEVIRQMKSKDLLKNLPAMFQAVQENMSTNLDLAQITSMALYAKDLDLEAMKRYTLPCMYLPEIDGTSFVGIKQSEKKQMMKEIFGISVKTDSSEDGYRIKDLAEQEKELKSSASSKISAAKKYVNNNSSYVSSSEKTKYNDYVSDLKDLINKSMSSNLSGGVSDLKSKINSFDKWMAKLKTSVEERIAAEATPSPSPTGSESPSPTGSQSPSPSPSSAPSPSVTATSTPAA